MLNYSAITILIAFNAFVVLANPTAASNKSKKNKDTAVSYTIMTKHEHMVQPRDQEDYQEYTAPHGQKHKHKEKHTTKPHEDQKGPAKYNFSYGVRDPMTGDIKKQWESRDGDKVKGGYSVKEADGSTRVVHYTADKGKGFEATVKKIPKSKKPKQKSTMETSKEKKMNVESLEKYEGL